MLSVLHRAMYGDDEQANEITKVLQQKPVQLVSELLQLASKGSSSPGPLVKLDAVSLARAKLLMGAAEVKFQTYDQVKSWRLRPTSVSSTEEVLHRAHL